MLVSKADCSADPSLGSEMRQKSCYGSFEACQGAGERESKGREGIISCFSASKSVALNLFRGHPLKISALSFHLLF